MSRQTERADAAWKEDLVLLVATAELMETVEYGSMARLLRVASEFLIRRAAFEKDLSSHPDELEETLGRVAEILHRHRVGERMEAAFQEGVEHLRKGERVELEDSPLPLVCRNCGGRYLPKY